MSQAWTQQAREWVATKSSREIILGGTGHRPPRLGLDYSGRSRNRLVDLIRPHVERIKPDVIISGFAQGFDQALAACAIECGISLLAALPNEGQESKWPAEAKNYYRRLLNHAQSIIRVCDGPLVTTHFLERDFFIVEASTQMLSLWDGKSGGGTATTVKYAYDRKIPVVNLWEEFMT